MIAENLVENLKPQFWNSAILFGVITALVTSGITYYTVKITNKAAEEREERNRKAAEEREERNRNEERQKKLRDDRKEAYIQFIKYINKADVRSNAKQAPPFDIEKDFDEFNSFCSVMILFSPKIAKIIREIVNKHSSNEKNLSEDWKNVSREFKAEVLPIMQEELGVELDIQSNQ